MNLQEKFVALKDELTARHIERYDEVDIALIALLSRYHTALIGPPGTAKSMLAQDLTHSFTGTNFFELDVMSKFTTPEELFGPPNIAKLEEGVYERVIDDSLAEAHVAFLDEAFKASPAILNRLLRIMNEREYKHGKQIIQVPLISMFVASNELPEGDELWAMFDRFQFRKVVDYIHEPGNFVRMLKLPEHEEMSKMSLQELYNAHASVDQVATGDAVFETLVEIRTDLQMEGIIVSDRRFRQTIRALKAAAWLAGRTSVSDTDFSILQHMLWTRPQEAKLVTRIVLSHTNPLEMQAQEIMDMADEIAGQLHAEIINARKGDDEAKRKLTKMGIEWFTKCRKLGEDLRTLETKAKTQGVSATKIFQARDRVKRVAQEVGQHTIGLDVVKLEDN